MPRFARLCGGRRVMSVSRKRIVPERIGSRPRMLSMIVVRPAPLRPTRQTTSSLFTASETPRRICACPRYVVMPSSSSSTASHELRNAEKDARHGFVGADRVGRAVGEKGAFVHHHDAIRIAKDDIHVVLDHDGCDRTRAYHRGYRIHDLRLLGAADPARRLVEEQ